MKVIITGDEAHLERAVEILRREMRDDWRKRYDRPGWGWAFWDQNKPRLKFWVTGLKDGISVKVTDAETLP